MHDANGVSEKSQTGVDDPVYMSIKSHEMGANVALFSQRTPIGMQKCHFLGILASF